MKILDASECLKGGVKLLVGLMILIIGSFYRNGAMMSLVRLSRVDISVDIYPRWVLASTSQLSANTS